MFDLRFRALVVALTLGLATQSHPLRAQNVLPAGSGALRVPPISDRSDVLMYEALPTPGDTTRKTLGGTTVEEHPVTVDGKPSVLLVYAQPKASRPYFDTALVRRDGLVPVWEHMHRGNDSVFFTYDGPRVRFTRTRPDSLPASADTTYQVPVFNFDELDLVVRSLPFTVEYEAILPLYSEGDYDLEMDTVRVVKSERTKSGALTWTVRFADPVIVGTYVIDDRSRRILAYSVSNKQSGKTYRRIMG
jgi:hypothetical protein